MNYDLDISPMQSPDNGHSSIALYGLGCDRTLWFELAHAISKPIRLWSHSMVWARSRRLQANWAVIVLMAYSVRIQAATNKYKCTKNFKWLSRLVIHVGLICITMKNSLQQFY